MRTKVLLTAALLAAGLASSMAQNVYSLNVVGYVNKTVAANQWYMWANPLKTGDNTTATVMTGLSGDPAPWDGSLVYGFTGSYTDAETYVAGVGWLPGTVDLTPGKGFFFFATTAGTVTFVGEVVTTNSFTLPANAWSMVGSAWPSTNSLVDVGLAGNEGDIVYRFNGSYNEGDTYVGGVGWLGTGPTEAGPVLDVGEAVFYQNVQGTQSQWVKNFTVQ